MSEDETLDKADKDTLNKLFDYFSKFNCEVNKIDEETYFQLSEEYTTLESEKRDIINKVCDLYIDYCQKNDFYDENDLVCKMFEKYGEENLPKYDYIIIDEVQDYTELQIYLLYKMCKNMGRIILAGDSHQMINPTMFSVKRINELFYDYTNNNQNLKTEFLSKNYRCSQNIISVANKLSQLRRKCIGSQEVKTEQDENSIRKGGASFRLNYSEENLLKMINEIVKYPTAVILVADESTKDKLIDLYGKEKYKDVVPSIYTVAEIKGMEYQYVVCYNLINTFYDVWQKILNNSDSKRKTKYRFYFNLIYVAITRAQDYLCFIDENLIPQIEDCLKLENIETFLRDQLCIEDLVSDEEDWLKQAQHLEEQGLYADALKIYDKYFPENNEAIYRCEAHISEADKDFETALQYYLLIEDINKVKKYINELDKESNLYKLSSVTTQLYNYTYDNGFDKEYIKSLVDKCYYNKNEKDKIMMFIIKLINKQLESMY